MVSSNLKIYSSGRGAVCWSPLACMGGRSRKVNSKPPTTSGLLNCGFGTFWFCHPGAARRPWWAPRRPARQAGGRGRHGAGTPLLDRPPGCSEFLESNTSHHAPLQYYSKVLVSSLVREHSARSHMHSLQHVLCNVLCAMCGVMCAVCCLCDLMLFALHVCCAVCVVLCAVRAVSCV